MRKPLLPVTKVIKIAPKLKISAFSPSISSFFHLSGELYSSEPPTCLTNFFWPFSSLNFLERPKSIITGQKSLSKTIFSGFISK